jgi:hypothetical protein
LHRTCYFIPLGELDLFLSILIFLLTYRYTEKQNAMRLITLSAYGGRTLDTLPTEVKNEIFSHFLLAKNVKYSTKGKEPGYKYKFNTAIMLVNKRLN